MQSIIGAIFWVLTLWGMIFGIAAGSFWIKLGIAVSILTLYAFWCERISIRVTRGGFIFGFISAAILYAIFAVGNFLSFYIIPHSVSQVAQIYDLGEGASRVRIIFLLLCVTGPGEEIFWRGFFQERLAQHYGAWRGLVFTTLLYGGAHVFSMNVMLIGAAFVAGAFWGLLYVWRRELFPLIVSHSLWSAFIFGICPIR